MDKDIKAFEDFWRQRERDFTPKNWAIDAFHLGMEIQNQKRLKPLTVNQIVSLAAISNKKISAEYRRHKFFHPPKITEGIVRILLENLNSI